MLNTSRGKRDKIDKKNSFKVFLGENNAARYFLFVNRSKVNFRIAFAL